MKIAVYCPLKSPNHPVPSGDRLMARLLIAALASSGHQVEIASEFRAFLPDASQDAMKTRLLAAEGERDRLSRRWLKTGAPDVWFCYHPYYKAPDLIGPALARDFGLKYVTAEASYSARRNVGAWADVQFSVLETIKSASVNICMTKRDRDGIAMAAPDARLELLSPFIDPALFLARSPVPEVGRLMTVAMMRAGDKMQSYAMLAQALSRLLHLPWQLDITGDGPLFADVQALFAAFDPDRINWHGEKSQAEIAELLSASSLYVWPGCGEAYGLAYLEAQAAGLPVVAQAIAGVPEVVADRRTGLLTSPGDTAAFAEAIKRLLTNNAERATFANAARSFVVEERSIDQAAARLGFILENYLAKAR